MTSLNDDHPGDIAHSSKSSMNVCADVRVRVPVPSQMLGGPESATAPLLPPLVLPPEEPLLLPLLVLPLPLPPLLVLPLVLPLLVLPPKLPLLLVLPLLPPLVLPPREPLLLPLLVLPLPPPLPLLLLTGTDGVPEQPTAGPPAAKERQVTTTTETRRDVFMWIPLWAIGNSRHRIGDFGLRKANDSQLTMLT
jgi:hypothetical protein